MTTELTAEETALIAVAKEFAATRITPFAAQWEASHSYPLETFSAAAELGLTRLLAPKELGGLAVSVPAMAAIVEALASACMAFTFGLVVHNNLIGNIANNGSAAQREKYLPPLMSGEIIGAFLLTEPQGGSDAAAVKTHARLEGDTWVLDGEKAWVSNGRVANLLSVYAQTDPELGSKGIACFLVDAEAPGVTRQPGYTMLGGHALGTSGYSFSHCQLNADAVLLPPGKGFKAAMAGIDLARLLVAAMCCGMLKSGLDCALESTATRQGFGKAVADNQGIQWVLADIATDLEASRLLAYKAANLLAAGEDATLAAAHAKKFATRVALSRLGDCMQCMGAPGLRDDHPVARHFAMAKIAQYLDGTTEIQNMVINRKLR